MQGWVRQELHDVEFLLSTGRNVQAENLFRLTIGPIVDMINDSEQNAIRTLGSTSTFRKNAISTFDEMATAILNGNIQPQDLNFADSFFQNVADQASKQNKYDALFRQIGIDKNTANDSPLWDQMPKTETWKGL